MTKTTKFYKQLYFRVICAIIVGIATSVLFAKTSISALALPHLKCRLRSVEHSARASFDVAYGL
jgi:hypothetical protein